MSYNASLFLGPRILIDQMGHAFFNSSILKSNLTNAEIVDPEQLITRGYATEMKTNIDADLLVERERLNALLLGADISVDTLLELKNLSDSIKTEGDAAHVNLASVIATLDAKHVADMSTEITKRDAEKVAYELVATQDDARFVTEQGVRDTQKATRDTEIAAAKVVADAKTQLDDVRFADEQARVNVVAVADTLRYDNEVVRLNQIKTDIETSIATHSAAEMTARVTTDEELRLKINADVLTEKVRAQLAEGVIVTTAATEKAFTAGRFDTEKLYTQGEVDALKARNDALELQMNAIYDYLFDTDRTVTPLRE
jgi:hypothetical protein